MLFKKLAHRFAIPRLDGTSPRLVWLMLSARFLDELWIGLFFVVLPIIRDDLGLTYGEVSVLAASFGWMTWIADPLTGLVGDVWPRRPLIAWSALGTAVVLVVLSGANSFAVMLLVCAGYCLTVTPLAAVADAVLIDTHPNAPGRILARQTFFDTVGAFLAPLTATILAVMSIGWPVAFLVGAGVFAAYGLLLWGTPFPARQAASGEEEDESPGGLRAMWRNVRTVARLPQVWRWLLFEASADLLTEVAVGFLALFLADEIGLDEAALGIFVFAYMAASAVSLAMLDSLLARWGERRVLYAAIVGAGALFPLLLLSQNPVVCFILLILLGAFGSPLYPISHARTLAAAEGLPVTVGVLKPLASIVSLTAPLVVGAVAGAAGLRTGMLILAAAPVLLLILLRTDSSLRVERQAQSSASIV